jgi:hypothetical protein
MNKIEAKLERESKEGSNEGREFKERIGNK